MKRSRGSDRELPRPAIADVLRELGATDVPTGYGWVRMHCYAHEDRTKSASVNHEKDAYTCHSCGRKGDALKMLQTELHLTFTETLERARMLTGDTPGTPRPRTRRRSELLRRELGL